MEHQKSANRDAPGSPPPFVIRHVFDDVDELAEVARAWDIDFRQLSRGGFRGSVMQAGTDRLQLGRVQLQGVLHQRGTTPAGLFTFAVPAAIQMNLNWRGHTIGRNEVLVHGPFGELESTSQPDFDMFLVSVPEAGLENACRRGGLSISERSVTDLERAPCERTTISDLRRWLIANLMSVMQNPSHLQEPRIAHALEEEMCDLIVRCLSPSFGDTERSSAVHHRRLVENAVCIARYRADEIHSVEALCRESGASERTLRRGFHERFGISPKAYLQAQRLIGVRRQLRLTNGRALVSDVANIWGFWHMGQFAAEYRRMFGELPSQTLRNEITMRP